jgi:hypothetical protein
MILFNTTKGNSDNPLSYGGHSRAEVSTKATRGNGWSRMDGAQEDIESIPENSSHIELHKYEGIVVKTQVDQESA